jgi:hypothetical protein
MCFLALVCLHGVRGEFIDDDSETAVGPIFTGPVKIGPTAVSETSSINSPRTQCRNTEAKKTVFYWRRKSEIEKVKCVLIFSTNFVWNISHSKKNLEICYKCENVFM